MALERPKLNGISSFADCIFLTTESGVDLGDVSRRMRFIPGIFKPRVVLCIFGQRFFKEPPCRSKVATGFFLFASEARNPRTFLQGDTVTVWNETCMPCFWKQGFACRRCFVSRLKNLFSFCVIAFHNKNLRYHVV